MTQAPAFDAPTLAATIDEAEPLAQQLMRLIASARPHPSPIQVVVACRMVAMVAGKVLLGDMGGDTELLQEFFDLLDTEMNIRRVITGEILISKPTRDINTGEPVAQRDAPKPRLDDAGVFDIDNWGKGTAP